VSRPELVPAGWLSAPDLLARFCDHLHDLSEKPLTAESATSVAALCIADAMAAARPGVAGFVQADGRTFMLPGPVWRELCDPTGEKVPDLVATFVNGRCRGRAFGKYEGLQLLFSYAETMIWLEPVARLAASKGRPDYRDPDRPWLDHTSPSAWLSSRRSTEFIDAKLAADGVTAPRPVDRNRALHACLAERGVTMEFSAVESRRRPSRMTD
jgi:hypothetical protein